MGAASSCSHEACLEAAQLVAPAGVHSWRSVLRPSCSGHVCAVALGGACSIDTAVVSAVAASASWSAAVLVTHSPRAALLGSARVLAGRSQPCSRGTLRLSSDLHLCHGAEGGRSKHNSSGGAAVFGPVSELSLSPQTFSPSLCR